MKKTSTQYWLVKQEPTAYAWEAFLRDGKTNWDGVRNFQARNNLRLMKAGDLVLYYHSVAGKEIVGVARVTREHFPDTTAENGDWTAVELSPHVSLASPLGLDTIKGDPLLSEMALIKQSRLSVMPVTPEQFKRVLEMTGTKLPAKS